MKSRRKPKNKGLFTKKITIVFIFFFLFVMVPFAVYIAQKQQALQGHSQALATVVEQSGSRITWQGKQWYVQGVNVPWYNWACDFGCNTNGGVSGNMTAIETGFQKVKDANAHMLRWWVFPGDPWQITRDSAGAPSGIDPKVYADFDAALQLADKYDLYYNFVLFSAATAPPKTWLTDATQRAKLASVLGQLFAHYAGNQRILSWEIYNEPEWQIWNNLIAQQPTVDTATAIAQSVHTNAPGTLVTIGQATIAGIGMWKDVGLDYYSPHWYDAMQDPNNDCARCVDYQTLQTRFGITQPVVIGEFYGGDSQALQKFTDFYNKGYAGAWAWSLFSDHTGDKLTIDFNALQTFTSQHTEIGPILNSSISQIPTPISPSSTPTSSPTPISTNTPIPTAIPTLRPTVTSTPGTSHGFLGMYFNNTQLSGTAVLTRIDPTLNFNWGSGSPASQVNVDNFSARWTGNITPPTTGKYIFYIRSDDGARVWVNNIEIVNQWLDHSAFTYSGSIQLVAGHAYSIRVEYYEHFGSAFARLYWSGPSVSTQIVPSSVVTH